jgi:hypothetical protein
VIVEVLLEDSFQTCVKFEFVVSQVQTFEKVYLAVAAPDESGVNVIRNALKALFDNLWVASVQALVRVPPVL